jgi:hypothetical protein
MKIITVNLPESYLKLLEKKSLRDCMNRSETIRLAIREYLRREFISSRTLKCPEFLSSEPQQDRIIKFYEHCINCEGLLGFNAIANHFFHKNIEIFKLQFCCSCFEKFKDKSFDEFPVDLIDKIQKKIKAYKEQYKEYYSNE